MKKRTQISQWNYSGETEYLDGWQKNYGRSLDDYGADYNYEWQCSKCEKWNNTTGQNNRFPDRREGYSKKREHVNKAGVFVCSFCGEETSDSGCFITSSVLKTLNKDDNCYELTKFREFRDNWLLGKFPNEIQEYYQISPKIVENINKQRDSTEIYEMIWNNYLSFCLSDIEDMKYQNAYTKYKKMVLILQKDFLE